MIVALLFLFPQQPSVSRQLNHEPLVKQEEKTVESEQFVTAKFTKFFQQYFYGLFCKSLKMFIKLLLIANSASLPFPRKSVLFERILNPEFILYNLAILRVQTFSTKAKVEDIIFLSS